MVTPRYLLDTNLLSEPLKAQPNPAAIAKLQRHRHEIATATAIAKAHDAIVVTRNEGDFQRFAEITVENWFLPDAPVAQQKV